MTINIKFETIDFWAKDIFYKKIYSGLNLNNYYSGIITINYLDNSEDEFTFTYKHHPSITISFLDHKPQCSLEYIYYFVRSIINESNKDILGIELKFTKKEEEDDYEDVE